MNVHTRDVLKLKAAIEFGSEFEYTIKQSTLGPTLIIFSPPPQSREKASELRKKTPSQWEDLRVIVTYSTADEEEDSLYDPNLV
tara:strand:+ start:402 stop:653 length:252 start_codon:yes stop_codon:yes gene_type:complete